MAERPVKRLRQQEDGTDVPPYHHISTPNDAGESSDDWQPQTPSNSRNAPSAGSMSRPQKATGGIQSSPSVTVSRSPSSPPEETKRSIRLTVKMPASKLREVTSSADARPHNIFTEPVVITGPRSSRSKKKIVEVDSDEEDDDLESAIEAEEEEDDDDDDDGDDAANDVDEDEEDEEDDEEEEDDDDDADAEADEDIDAEGDPDPDVDAEGDIDMDDVPPVSHHHRSRPTVTVTPVAAAKVRNVEARNVDLEEEDDDDDEELSELGSEPEAEKGEDTILQEEGEDEEEVEEEEDEEMEEEDEEDEIATPMEASRASSPGYTSRMTKRQRERLQYGDFLQLPMEPQVKKHLTAEEHAMRRAEMARRRKNLSEKRNEEEKMDTINKLLKKQAPKRRGKISAAETAGEASPRVQEAEEGSQPEPTMVRYVMNRDGCRLGVPNEWLGTPAGLVFGSRTAVPSGQGHGRLVEEL
ncbi:hypothetical protein D8B26_000381 [Coccidioides posadasii str. Silveira]|uniref:Uncharacterized protein n=1 Tax=Coccidioides posadasii (strain RMSCC 757 / Silveira) TaxID=443226 RepID=E9DF84_COCPS|nr:conserved hypothetical protein [Coccidioides posadasii str. Silveira]QVM05675.1 hypothetical protein D8B26_000381 [Coccidioides posadasii str. Silveira]